MPYYAEWLLSFPRAPVGSISIQAWSLACAAIILLVSDALVATVALVMGSEKGPAEKVKGEPMKLGADKTSSEKTSTEKSKKEL